MLPEGWQASSIGAHTEVLSGFAFRSEDYISSGEGIKLLRGDNVGQGKLRWRDVKRYPQSKTASLTRYQLHVGDFVIAMDRTWIPAGVKVSEVFSQDLPCLLVQRVARLRTKPSLRQDLLRQFFSGQRFEQFVRSAQTETAVPHISPNDIKAFEIAVPPLPEQRRIAEILSTWDQAIETVEKLIANSRAHRSGMIAELLENPSWPLREIGSFGVISSAGVDKTSDPAERPVRLLNYTDVFKRDHIASTDLSHWVTASDRQRANCDVRKGDIFFTPSSETADDIAHSAVAVEDINDAAYSYHVVRLRLAEPWDFNFRAFAFKSAGFYRQAQALCAGSGQRYVLSQGQFREIAIRVPPLPEQRAIGDALKAVDDEGHLYSAILGALRQEKSALMQQLLTGKRRVRIDTQAEQLQEAAA